MQTMDVSRLRVAALVVATLGFTACGGGGGSSGGGGTVPVPAPSSTIPVATPTPGSTATPAPPGPSSQTITTSAGSVSGQTGGFSPAEGDTASGGQGQPIDNTTCDTSMSDNYHIHAFIGVYNNGTLMALPAGVGMQNPQPPANGFVDVASCFYHLHTHDQSGIVHIEDPNPGNIPISASMYTLKTLLDIWGITADANHFGPFQGPVRVFTSGAISRANSNGNTVAADTLTYFGSDPRSIPMYAHEVIFIEVGPNYPSSLPNVHFYVPQ